MSTSLARRLARIGVASALAVVGIVSHATFAFAAPAGPIPPTAFGKAVELKPPPENSNTGRDDALTAVACPARSACSAGGNYLDPSFNSFPMVTGRANGKWGPLVALQLPDNFDTGQHAGLNGIACGAAGSCAAVGSYSYTGGGGQSEPFVADEVGGSWQQAIQIGLPGNAAIPVQAVLSAIACTSRRSCVAVGNYVDKSGNTQLMAVAEIAGIWQGAREVTVPRGAAKPVSTLAAGVSCVAAGRCVAVGGYLNGKGRVAPLSVRESSGKWGRAIAISLPRNADNVSNFTFLENFLDSVSCTPSGFCLAAGSYFVKAKRTPIRPMTLSGSNGLSGRTFEVTAAPPLAGKNPIISQLFSVSCATSARCVAVGQIERDLGGAFRAMSLIRTSGKWGNGHEIVLPPDADKTSMQIASMNSVSCTRTGFCAAVGGYVYVPDLNIDLSAMAAVLP